MTRNFLETILGAVVLAVAIAFFYYAYQSSNGSSSGYDLFAQFDRIDGLDNGADVRIGGIKVGSVTQQTLDPATYRRQGELHRSGQCRAAALDTSAAIMSDGLLGGKYLSLEPGGDIDMLEAGDEVTLTQSSIRLEDLIGQLIYSGGSGGEQNGAEDPVTQ